jgi:hypothetical protein
MKANLIHYSSVCYNTTVPIAHLPQYLHNTFTQLYHVIREVSWPGNWLPETLALLLLNISRHMPKK